MADAPWSQRPRRDPDRSGVCDDADHRAELHVGQPRVHCPRVAGQPGGDAVHPCPLGQLVPRLDPVLYRFQLQQPRLGGGPASGVAHHLVYGGVRPYRPRLPVHRHPDKTANDRHDRRWGGDRGICPRPQ